MIWGAFHEVFSVIFTDKFVLSQSAARISVAYNSLSVENTDIILDVMPPTGNVILATDQS